ncbi:MAG: FAD-dependent oxidoreductase [Candidatus Dormibacteraeota bacterium]|nr:FAD-dependent oxidoreductase [Candidatus Dormibacteraeota bacterium]
MSASPRPDVVVVGAGIAGLSIAWELSRRGQAVTVLRSSRPATSLIAAGMLAPMPEVAINPPLGRLATEALRYYPDFLEALADETDRPTGFVRSGLLRVAYSAEEAVALREAVGQYEAAGMPSRWLSPAAAAKEVPGLGTGGLAGGLLSFDEAQVQPAWLLAALEAGIVARGGEVIEAEVEAVEEAGDAAALRTPDGVITADRVVLALGSWSGTLPGLDYPVRPVKGQLLAFPPGAPGPEVILYRDHNYLLTKADGTVVLGGTVEADAGFSLNPDERVEELRRLLPELWPALVGAEAQVRVGLRPAAPDGLPVIGGLPALPHAYVFTAHYRNGFLLSPYSARLAADEILEAREAPLLRPMRPGRLGVEAPSQ